MGADLASAGWAPTQHATSTRLAHHNSQPRNGIAPHTPGQNENCRRLTAGRWAKLGNLAVNGVARHTQQAGRRRHIAVHTGQRTLDGLDLHVLQTTDRASGTGTTRSASAPSVKPAPFSDRRAPAPVTDGWNGDAKKMGQTHGWAQKKKPMRHSENQRPPLVGVVPGTRILAADPRRASGPPPEGRAA